MNPSARGRHVVLQPLLMGIRSDPTASPRVRVALQRAKAREALAVCATTCGAPAGDWPQGGDGAPLPRDGWHWSISHKPAMVAAVLAERPVGIDVECVVPRRHAGLWTRLADEREWDAAGRRDWEMFFRLWTAKEATLKANGRGIGGFDDCRVIDVPDEQRVLLRYRGASWSVEHYRHHGHIAAVTAVGAAVHWTVSADR